MRFFLKSFHLPTQNFRNHPKYPSDFCFEGSRIDWSLQFFRSEFCRFPNQFSSKIPLALLIESIRFQLSDQGNLLGFMPSKRLKEVAGIYETDFFQLEAIPDLSPDNHSFRKKNCTAITWNKGPRYLARK